MIERMCNNYDTQMYGDVDGRNGDPVLLKHKHTNPADAAVEGRLIELYACHDNQM